MVNYIMSTPEIPDDPFVPILPRVSEDAVKEVNEVFEQNPDYLRDTLGRLMAEQPGLIGGVVFQARSGARDDQEILHAMEIAALMYSLLEAQQGIDQRQ